MLFEKKTGKIFCARIPAKIELEKLNAVEDIDATVNEFSEDLEAT